MNDFIIKMADGVVRSVKAFVEQKISPLDARIEVLEKREPTMGPQGEPGRDGVNGKPGADGEKGEPGDRGADGTNGIDGTNGLDGKDGADGKDGINGKDGVDGERGTDGLNGKDGVDGLPGKDGERGQKGEQGEKGIDGEHGRDGRDGEHGMDGFRPDVKANADLSRSYPRGTIASFRGGIWQAGAKTEAEKGWDLLVRGIDTIELEQDEQDYRKQTWKVTLSDGVKVFMPRNDAPCWADAYKSERDYTRGDMVVFGGSTWIANGPTREAPGTGTKDWTVLARKGRDGKDGEKGLKGEDGRPGRDLTPLGPNGLPR